MTTLGVPASNVLDGQSPLSIPEKLDRFLGPTFFFLAAIFLVLAAGVIHRLGHSGASELELAVMYWGLLICWPLLAAEGFIRFLFCHRPATGLARRAATFVGVCFFPPLRLCGRSSADPARIWLPFLGWTAVDHHLRCRLERLFSVPMLIIAVLMVPLLVAEHFWLDQVRRQFVLLLLLDIGTALVWLAFALEFIVMVSLAESVTAYCLQNWLNLAVVCLPLVDFLPLLRLLRLSRLMELEQIARFSRLYRLRGLLTRSWRAILLLEMIQRLLGNYPERHLKHLRRRLAMREEEISDLRQEIAEIEKLLANDVKSISEHVPSHRPSAEPGRGA
jgi:voltage-gated potassium channel